MSEKKSLPALACDPSQMCSASLEHPPKGIPKELFCFDLSTPVIKGNFIPDHIRLLALEIINAIPSDAIKIYTDGSRINDLAGGSIYIEKRGERSTFCHRNPDFSCDFKNELMQYSMALRQFLMNRTLETSGSSLIALVISDIFIIGSQWRQSWRLHPSKIYTNIRVP
ncbi:hypothetical protein TNCV_1944431 [Trichonephila clavipes]|nr:hypothetical protein TNCV_1944431 [Trichonephila clavipes]